MEGLNTPPSLLPIFESKIQKGKECWTWKGCVYKSTGYGVLQHKRLRYYAHRLSYSYYVAKPTKGMFIDHICRNRMCVNPAHLREVTPRINSIENSKGVTAKNAGKTHCFKGHPLSGDNLKLVNNTRQCVICVRRRWRDWARRKRENSSK